MFPSAFFSQFPAFPASNIAFVAMSFHASMDSRWNDILKPAIGRAGLEPLRIDASSTGDSIITEILQAIARARVIIVDISVIDGCRNPNVLYELGIAHAIRLPVEVVIMRSDAQPLPFNLSGVRVHSYPVDGYAAAALVETVLKTTLSEIDLLSHLAVRRAAEVLDYRAFSALANANGARELAASLGIAEWHPFLNDVFRSPEGDDATTRLLELGLLHTTFRPAYSRDEAHGKLEFGGRPLAEVFVYRLSPLGEAVLKHIAREFSGSWKAWQASMDQRNR
jgi:hypothetical protein